MAVEPEGLRAASPNFVTGAEERRSEGFEESAAKSSSAQQKKPNKDEAQQKCRVSGRDQPQRREETKSDRTL